MQSNNDPNSSPVNHPPAAERNTVAPWVSTGALLAGLAGIGFGFYSHEQATRLAESQKASMESVNEMQQQVRTLKELLAARDTQIEEISSTLAATRQEVQDARQAAEPPAAPVRTKPTVVRQAARKPAPKQPVEDPRVSQLEKRLSEQDQKLADTQRSVDAARSDLESRINATSTELSGSIARTSEEVAELRRRGERDYYEFDIPKSKVAQRIGPIGLTLRKADLKRKRYNVEMFVDDNKLEKKNVNLFEPVYVNAPEWQQPLELVVNRVSKDRVSGYLSVPKLKRAEVASTGQDRRLLAPPNNGSKQE